MTFREASLRGLYRSYCSERDLALANVDAILANPVAIGEHGDVTASLRKQIERAERAESMMEFLENWYGEKVAF